MSWSAAAAPTPGNTFTVNWTASDPNSYISINVLVGASNGLFSLVTCNQQAGAGSFTVPGYVTAAMTAGTGYVGVAQVSVPVRFSASGIDQGYFSYAIGALSNSFTFGGGGTKE
jgi:hypothetical protein